MKKYHERDSTWEVFNLDTFERFCEIMVVPGRFHQAVPKDVVDSYKLSERIMAYAYYHYPLYDEAFSKILRITEMAVKLRCQEVSIDLFTGKLDKQKRPVKKQLHSLIIELTKVEPDKNIGDRLHGLRRLRNNFMHPNHHSFAPTAMLAPIKFAHSVLNSLFESNETLKIRHAKRKELETKFRTLCKDEILGLEIDEKVYPFSEFSIVAVSRVDNNYIFPFVPFILDLNRANQINNHTYKEIKPVHVTIANENSESITLKDIRNNKNIVVKRYPKEFFAAVLAEYEKDIVAIDESNRRFYQLFIDSQLANIEFDFEYTFGTLNY